MPWLSGYAHIQSTTSPGRSASPRPQPSHIFLPGKNGARTKITRFARQVLGG
jgi:hypothetical protein